MPRSGTKNRTTKTGNSQCTCLKKIVRGGSLAVLEVDNEKPKPSEKFSVLDYL